MKWYDIFVSTSNLIFLVARADGGAKSVFGFSANGFFLV